MKPSLFYNYRNIGDVLIVVINPFLVATRHVNNKDITVLYNNNEIIGYNIFNISQIIKIHHQGLLVSPIKPLVDVINNILKNHDLPQLMYDDNPSFIVGKVVDAKNDIYFIDIKEEIVQVQYRFTDININDLVVYIKPDTMCLNARISHLARLGTKRLLMLEDNDEILKLDDEKLIGSDFYSGEVKWSN